MKHLQVENGTCKVVRETEKAYLLTNADNFNNVTAWFPKAAFKKLYDVTWASGEVVTRYELEKWFYKKATTQHDVVLGRAV